MVITDAAAQVIREWLRASSNLSRPAIYLGRVSDVPTEVAEAQKRGVDRRELADITKQALKSQPGRLCPLVYPSSHFIWLTTTISGFRFASFLFYSSPTRRVMKDGVLDAIDRSLVLRDANGKSFYPQMQTMRSNRAAHPEPLERRTHLLPSSRRPGGRER
jgi:hypothetical protein